MSVKTLHEKALEHQDRVLRGDLTRARIIGGLSRKEVARRMGIPPVGVERIEEGKGKLLMSTLRRYCLAVGVVIDWQLVVPTSFDESDEPAVEEPTDG